MWCEMTRCRSVDTCCCTVDLLFSLVWVPGKHQISILGHKLKRLGTTAVPEYEDQVEYELSSFKWFIMKQWLQ